MRYLYISLILTNLALTAPAQSIITTVCGNGTAGFSGDGTAATNAELQFPRGVALDAAGNMYIADTYNSRIRMVNTSGIISTIAGNGIFGFSGDGGQATNAELNHPMAVAIDAIGNLFIADANNSRIRKINTAGIMSTYAGNGIGGFSGDGGQASAAEINYPTGIALDATGNLYIAEFDNGIVRMVSITGIISTFVSDAGIDPFGVALDAAGNLYIAGYSNHLISMVNTAGIISTVAGNGFVGTGGIGGYSGDGGQATDAELNYPTGVACDAAGNLCIVDQNNNRIRKVNTSGIISTVAGNGATGFSGDGAQATAAKLNAPNGVALDAAGNLYIADYGNNRIRKVTNVGQAGIQQVAGNNLQVNIYPNPASSSLQVTFSDNIQNTTLQITDMLGNTVKQSIIYNPTSIINIADLSEGVYTISITSNEGVVNKRVVIVR